MKNVLLSFRNDRGREDRLSTDHGVMELDLYFKHEGGFPVKCRLEVTHDGKRLIVRDARNRSVSLHLDGQAAPKLARKA